MWNYFDGVSNVNNYYYNYSVRIVIKEILHLHEESNVHWHAKSIII